MKLLAAVSNFGTGLDPATDAFSAGSKTSIGDATGNLEKLISNAIGGITIFAGLAFLLYFILGGLAWVTAAGEQGKIDKARQQMTQGVTGMVVIVLAYALVGIIGTFLGLKILTPGDVIQTLKPPGT